MLNRNVVKLAQLIQDPYTVEGKTKGGEITLTVNQPATYIDFENSSNNVNIPAAQQGRIYFPSRKVAKLTLINEGKADVRYDTNVEPNETFGYSLVRNGRIINIELQKNKIYSIVVHAIQNPDLPAETTARLRLEYLF